MSEKFSEHAKTRFLFLKLRLNAKTLKISAKKITWTLVAAIRKKVSPQLDVYIYKTLLGTRIL